MLSDQQTIEMVYELVGRANQAMVNFLNEAAHEIHARAQVEVPKADVHEVRPNEPTYPPEPLYKRSHVLQAIPEHLAAYVVYPGPYAAAQEAGEMTEERHDKEVAWVAQHYTTAGTKSHYLEDAGKSVMPTLPEQLAIQGHLAVNDIPGFRYTKQELMVEGRSVEMALPPTGPEAQIMAHEQALTTSISPSSLLEPPGGKRPPTS